MAGQWGYMPMHAQEHHSRAPRLSTHLRSISLEYSYIDLCNSTNNWHASRKLGSGSYGAVFKGEMGDGSEVAIKAIDCAALAANGQTIESAGFEEEVQMLSKFRHPNLVTLMGWGKTEGARYLVYEFLSGGDAFQRISKANNGKLTFLWYERLSVAYDAALGLSHMHNAKPQAFHRDIKSANVLLDRHGQAKMADFGLSCSTKVQGATSVQVKTISGTPGYACPIYSRTGRVTEGSEVYSFGMVMLELLCAMAPAMANPRQPGQIIYPIADNVTPTQPDALNRALRHTDANAQWPPQLQKDFAELGLRCVSVDEKHRPKFKEVVQALRRLMEVFPGPEKVVGSIPPSFASQVPQLPQHLVNPQQPVSIQAAAVSAQNQIQAHTPKASMPPGNSSEAHFYLLLTHASGVNADTLDASRRKLIPATTTDALGQSIAVIGRQHQPELFEQWLPDFALRNCISRNAFELTWSGSGENISFTMRGANPMIVDGRQVQRNMSAGIGLGSEVGFLYAHDERKSFLTLKLLPAMAPPDKFRPAGNVVSEVVPGSERRKSQHVSVEGVNGGSIKMEVEARTKPRSGSQSSPPEAQRVPRSVTPTKQPPSTTFKHFWRLECTMAEGLSNDALANLPSEIRNLVLQENFAQVGRQHQPNLFEALLSGKPSLLSFISRAHVSLEARGGVLVATNLSSNPIYIDKKVLDRGESRNLVKDQQLSFARNEGSQHVNFITFAVRSPEDKNYTGLVDPALVGSQGHSKPSSESRSRRPTTEIGNKLMQESSTFKCFQGAVIGGNVSDLCILKMTPEEARVKASSLADCAGFTYEGTPTGGPFTMFFKSAWDPNAKPGWCSYRKESTSSPTHVPQQAPAVSSSTSPQQPTLSSGYQNRDSPHKRFSSDAVSLDSLIPAHSPEVGTLPVTRKVQSVNDLPPSWQSGSRLPETRRVNGAADLPDSWRRPSDNFQDDQQLSMQNRSKSEPGKVQMFQNQQDLSPKQMSQERGRIPATSSAPPAPSESITINTRIVLELSGDGVLPVPLEQRRIGPVSLVEPVLVGRRHQPELHRQAIQKECLQFLSRDHFKISYLARTGGYEIMALTNNPIWLIKRWTGADPIELHKDASMPMEFGDRVALGTGMSTTNAEEAINRLCWLFRCSHEDNANYQEASSSERRADEPRGNPWDDLDRPESQQWHRPESQQWHRPESQQWQRPESQWEPMLPPASAMQHQRHDRNDRPSEIFAPEVRGLHSDNSNGTPTGGSSVRSTGVMRPPIDFMGRIPEDCSPRGAWGGTNNTMRPDDDELDNFAKSGFSYREF